MGSTTGGLAVPKASQSATLTIISFLVMGALVAMDAPLRSTLVAGLAVILGLTTGYVNGAAMSEAMLGTLGLVGSVTSLFMLVALAAALVVSLRIPWTRIVVRVAGSWIAAAGLLLLGWAEHNERAKLRSEWPLNPQQQVAVLPVNDIAGTHHSARMQS